MCAKYFSFQGFQGKVFITNNNIIHIQKIYREFIIIHIQTDDVTSQKKKKNYYKRVDKNIEEKIFIFLLSLCLFYSDFLTSI